MNTYVEVLTCSICNGKADAVEKLLPDRAVQAAIWRYLVSDGRAVIQESPMCLCRKIVRWSGKPLSIGKMLTCLDIFADVHLIDVQRLHKHLTIRLLPSTGKTDLNRSQTMQRLLQGKES